MGRPSHRQLAGWWSFWALVQLLVVTLPTWLRARGFGFSNYDLGIYSQALARLAVDPPNPWLSGRQIHLFNDHFDPVLFLVAPFARIFPAVQVGLFVEGLCAVLALVPLGWLARRGKLSLRALWMLGGVLVLHPGVTQALGFPFHPTAWAMAPMAWLLAALILERWRIALFALVLLLCCKEEFPFVGLALSPVLFMRAPRRMAWLFVVISAAWGVFALVLRPRLLGEVMPYASMPFRGLQEGLGAFLSARLSRSALASMGDLIVSFLPLLIWLGWERLKRGRDSLQAKGRGVFSLGDRSSRAESRAPHLWLFAALVPMLGIRFLSMAWRDHYGAVVVAAAVLAFAAVVQNRLLPWAVVISTLMLVVINDEQLIKRDWQSLNGSQGWAASSGCVDSPQRASAVRAAVERVRPMGGPIFVSGNVLPWLAERADVYAFGGPQPETIIPRVVLIERPPCGDTWARSLEEREALYAKWRKSSTAAIDDEFVFVGATQQDP